VGGMRMMWQGTDLTLMEGEEVEAGEVAGGAGVVGATVGRARAVVGHQLQVRKRPVYYS